MPLLHVPWLQRFWQKLVDVAVQAWGSSSKALVILSQTRAILAHHSNEIHRKLLYLAHAIGWNDGRLCCRCSHRLFDNFGMWRLYRVYAFPRFCCEVRIFFGCTGRCERCAQHNMVFTTTTVDVWQCCVPLSLSDTSSAIPTTRVWRVEEEKELSNVSQSMRNESLLYLISIHKVFDFLLINLVICIGSHAYSFDNLHMHIFICICVF